MALTLRLTDEEKSILDMIQLRSGKNTASGTLKYMITNFQSLLNRVSVLETREMELYSLSKKHENTLDEFKTAWSVLENIAKSTTSTTSSCNGSMASRLNVSRDSDGRIQIDRNF